MGPTRPTPIKSTTSAKLQVTPVKSARLAELQVAPVGHNVGCISGQPKGSKGYQDRGAGGHVRGRPVTESECAVIFRVAFSSSRSACRKKDLNNQRPQCNLESRVARKVAQVESPA